MSSSKNHVVCARCHLGGLANIAACGIKSSVFNGWTMSSENCRVFRYKLSKFIITRFAFQSHLIHYLFYEKLPQNIPLSINPIAGSFKIVLIFCYSVGNLKIVFFILIKIVFIGYLASKIDCGVCY